MNFTGFIEGEERSVSVQAMNLREGGGGGFIAWLFCPGVRCRQVITINVRPLNHLCTSNGMMASELVGTFGSREKSLALAAIQYCFIELRYDILHIILFN